MPSDRRQFLSLFYSRQRGRRRPGAIDCAAGDVVDAE